MELTVLDIDVQRITIRTSDKSAELLYRHDNIHIIALNLIRTNSQRVRGVRRGQAQNIVLDLNAHHTGDGQELVLGSSLGGTSHHVLEFDGRDFNLRHYDILLFI